MLNYELQNIISGKGKVKHGTFIQTVADYLRRSQETGSLAETGQPVKRKEEQKLIEWIERNNYWVTGINIDNYLSEGAEQKVYLETGKCVLKLNDAIYYESWLDYFYNLLLNNHFFPDTAYELKGFFEDSKIFYAVVEQRFVKANETTDLNLVKEFMQENGFKNVRNNDYFNEALGIILEDLHDENVLTQDGVLCFIDTVFYIK